MSTLAGRTDCIFFCVCVCECRLASVLQLAERFKEVPSRHSSHCGWRIEISEYSDKVKTRFQQALRSPRCLSFLHAPPS